MKNLSSVILQIAVVLFLATCLFALILLPLSFWVLKDPSLIVTLWQVWVVTVLTSIFLGLVSTVFTSDDDEGSKPQGHQP